ncbi:hypothetical protein tb265_09780 [Gemmatimonadetes bacterium T265]|nr:hypothetical protein tb265_09780 [Gemmatimonadetes bacterium T265]
MDAPAGREELWARLRAQRAASLHFCARADAERRRAVELRDLMAEQSHAWRRWHRLWSHVAVGGPVSGRAGQARPLVRVCMYCARVHSALDLARDEAEADAAWRPVPHWVRDGLREGKLRVIPSHGMCPACARQRGMD